MRNNNEGGLSDRLYFLCKNLKFGIKSVDKNIVIGYNMSVNCLAHGLHSYIHQEIKRRPYLLNERV